MNTKVLRKAFSLKMDEVSEQFRVLHNKELCELYRSPIVVRIVK